MSFPSVAATLARQGVTVDQATEQQQATALLEAFTADLPLGMAFLDQLAGEVRHSHSRQLRIENPSSAVGRQLIRLVGADIPRQLLEQHYGIALGLYNCCAIAAAPTSDRLQMTLTEQIKLQNGDLAYADC